VRILVDQSGYDLLNIGDVAMLQSCIARLKRQWPEADIMVIARDPARLQSYCPDVIAIWRTLADRPLLRYLPPKSQAASEQVWKMVAPYFSGRLGHGHVKQGGTLTAIQAVQGADLVVASGGGYVTDTWWWHAAGVLSLLSLAQRLGKPTAMFGQGIGPLGQRTLRAQASAVMPKLKVIGLREARMGQDLVLALGVSPEAVVVTGDDALELIDNTNVANGYALGVNVRVSGYAGVEAALAAAVGELVLEAATALKAPIVGLPVCRYARDADIVALRALLFRRDDHADIVLNDIVFPKDLVSAAGSCRAIVTGSYHAAVFGLAQGVPTVCLTKSSYYDAKFSGLQALFPGACFVIPLDASDWTARLRAAISQAWHLPAPVRTVARDTAVCLRDAGREAYARFRVEVESSARPAAPGPRLARSLRL
jgi:polysaccharide pyruvyl transferase WcaK-like protein